MRNDPAECLHCYCWVVPGGLNRRRMSGPPDCRNRLWLAKAGLLPEISDSKSRCVARVRPSLALSIHLYRKKDRWFEASLLFLINVNHFDPLDSTLWSLNSAPPLSGSQRNRKNINKHVVAWFGLSAKRRTRFLNQQSHLSDSERKLRVTGGLGS